MGADHPLLFRQLLPFWRFDIILLIETLTNNNAAIATIIPDEQPV